MANWIARTDLALGELGWAAGVIDGEGCISICGRPGRTTKKGVRALQLIVSVVNTDPRMPKKMQDYFGGYFGRSCGVQRDRRRPTFLWLLTGRPAGSMLKLVYPFLVIKREQADIAFTYAETIRNKGPLTPVVQDTRAILQSDLRLLKRVSHG